MCVSHMLTYEYTSLTSLRTCPPAFSPIHVMLEKKRDETDSVLLVVVVAQPVTAAPAEEDEVGEVGGEVAVPEMP
eukprot:3709898-Pyramimonas_sp.AAC.1